MNLLDDKIDEKLTELENRVTELESGIILLTTEITDIIRIIQTDINTLFDRDCG